MNSLVLKAHEDGPRGVIAADLRLKNPVLQDLKMYNIHNPNLTDILTTYSNLHC